MAKIRNKNAHNDAFLQQLKDHDHVIDCITWAPYESCVIIDKGRNKSLNDGNGEIP